MGKIATEQEAYGIGQIGTPETNRLATKARAVDLGCTVIGDYEFNKCVQYEDLKNVVIPLELNYVNLIENGDLTGLTEFSTGEDKSWAIDEVSITSGEIYFYTYGFCSSSWNMNFYTEDKAYYNNPSSKGQLALIAESDPNQFTEEQMRYSYFNTSIIIEDQGELSEITIDANALGDDPRYLEITTTMHKLGVVSTFRKVTPTLNILINKQLGSNYVNVDLSKIGGRSESFTQFNLSKIAITFSFDIHYLKLIRADYSFV